MQFVLITYFGEGWTVCEQEHIETDGNNASGLSNDPQKRYSLLLSLFSAYQRILYPPQMET
jgi:hypothetical protein